MLAGGTACTERESSMALTSGAHVQGNGSRLHFEVVSPSGVPATTTPEPSSMALLGTGLVGHIPMLRRRLNA